MISFLSHPGKVFFLLAACCIFVNGSLTDCQSAEAQARNIDIKVHQLALMPFLQVTSEAQKKEQRLEKNIDCQLLGLCSTEENVFSKTEETVTTLAQSELRRKFGDKLVPMTLVSSKYREMDRKPTDTPRDVAVHLGQNLGVDHILVGLIWRYQERVGSAMAASEPASVAFSLFMVNVASQEIVWEGSFHKTQTSLSENLLDTPMFLKKGLKWLNAEELSSFGIQKIFKKLSIK